MKTTTRRVVGETPREREWRLRLLAYPHAAPIAQFAPPPAELLDAQPDPNDQLLWFAWCAMARDWWAAQEMPPCVVDLLWADLVAERLRLTCGWPVSHNGSSERAWPTVEAGARRRADSNAARRRASVG